MGGEAVRRILFSVLRIEIKVKNGIGLIRSRQAYHKEEFTLFTGVLRDDCTDDQIGAAKKVVRITTEVNGHQYVSEYEGIGAVVLTYNPVGDDSRIEGECNCTNRAMKQFIDSLFELLPVRDRLSLMLNLSLKLLEKSAGEQ